MNVRNREWWALLVVLLALLAFACLVRRTDAAGETTGREVITWGCADKVAPGKKLFGSYYLVETDRDKIEAERSACVTKTEPDYIVHTYSDPAFSQQWDMRKIGVEQAWTLSTGSGVVVAILDTGVDFNHPDLAGQFVSRGRDFVNNDNDATDDNGHGTHVAGTVLAATNGQGISGVAPGAKELPVKVLANTGSGSIASAAEALDWASQQPGVKVVNMSFGCGGCSTTYMQAAINAAHGRGVTVVAAAGNDSSSQPSYPAANENVLAVGATDQNDRRAGFSNYGSYVDVAAPGVGIYSTLPNGQYAAWNGTSMAAPHVAGAAALIYARFPGISVSQVEARLLRGDDIGNQQIGKRLNVYKALDGDVVATPTRSLTVVPPQPSAIPADDFNRQTFALVNAKRVQNGLGPLIWDDRILQAAQTHNTKMNNCAKGLESYALESRIDALEDGCFSHQLPGEPDPNQRVAATGFPTLFVLEDIAQGYNTPQKVVDAWMNSAGHRAAILDSRVTHGAAAYLDGSGTGYYGALWWTLDLVKSSQAVATLTPTPTGAQPTVVVPPTRALQPTPTPTTANGLPSGWSMLIIIDYDHSTYNFVHEMYNAFCTGQYTIFGVRCKWVETTKVP